MDKVQEKYYNFIKQGGDLNYVPERHITQEMSNIYMDNGGDLSNVPEQYITNEMCDNYIENGGTITHVPEQYITNEMCDNYIQNGGTITHIPKQFITRERCDRYINNGGELRFVPEQYITKEMCDKYIENDGSITDIPEQYITGEMCNIYFNKSKDIKGIPEQYITKTLCIRYIKCGGLLSVVPKKFIEKIKLSNEQYIEQIKKGVSIEYIPIMYINKRLVEVDLKKRLKKISKNKQKEYIMHYYSNLFNITNNINLIPDQYLTDEMKEYTINHSSEIEKNSEAFNYLQRCQTKKQIEEELYNLPLSLKTLEQLECEYNVDNTYIDEILDIIKAKYPTQYFKIKKTLNDNSLRFKRNMIKSIKKMNIIADAIGKIEYSSKVKNVGKYAKKLSHEQQICLSYLLFKSGIYGRNLYKVYDSLNNSWITQNIEMSKEEFKKVSSLLELVYPNIKSVNFQSLSSKEKRTIFEQKNSLVSALYPYNPKNYFCENDKIVKRSFCTKDGTIIQVNEENTEPIIKILKDKNVPLTNIIVKEAFKLYFKEGTEGVNHFIKRLHLYNPIVQAAKEYAGDISFKLKKNSPKTMFMPLSILPEAEDFTIKQPNNKITGYQMKKTKRKKVQ